MTQKFQTPSRFFNIQHDPRELNEKNRKINKTIENLILCGDAQSPIQYINYPVNIRRRRIPSFIGVRSNRRHFLTYRNTVKFFL